MLQLEILSGSKAGLLWDARHFPARLGRSPESELQLEDDGVWAEHFTLTSDATAGFSLIATAGTAVMVNQTPVQEARLKNGDIITIGAVKIAFRLAATKQRGLLIRESLVWALIAAISFGQLALIGWLLRAASQ